MNRRTLLRQGTGHRGTWPTENSSGERLGDGDEGRILVLEVVMANDPKTDLEQGKRDTAGRPVIKAPDEEKRQEEEEKSDQPKDPE